MPAPSNPHEFPAPAQGWRPGDKLAPNPAHSLSKVARLWGFAKAILEQPVAILAHYAHRVVDRTTGIPYSADELEAKILEQTGSGTVESLTTSDGSAAAAAGKLGEYVSGTRVGGSAITLTDLTAANVTSISLTAGDWDVAGVVTFLDEAASTTVRGAIISTTSASFVSDGSESWSGCPTTLATGNHSASVSRKRIRVTTTTTVYLVALSSFSAGTVKAYGQLTARRVR